jgi:hypothetical protein
MDNIKKNKKALAVLGVIIVVFAGYMLLSDGSADLALEYLPSDSSYDDSVGRSIIRTLNELKAISIDENFFKNPVFKSLVDYRVSTSSEPVGRIDPFAPLPGSEEEGKRINSTSR